MYSPCDSRTSVGRVASDRFALSAAFWPAAILLSLIVVAAFSLPIAAQDAEISIEPVATSVVVEDIFVAQPPKPKAKPAAPAPAKKAPAADAKKPPRGASEPPAGIPPQPEPPRTDLVPDLGLLAFRTPSLRLASVPNMLGDFFNQAGQIQATDNLTTASDLALAGGGYRLKVAENNKALPMNRCYFMYNHFHNALEADTNIAAPGSEFSSHVDRYTIGLERTFRDDLWSVDLRIPFAASQQFNSGGLAIEGGSVGNLQVTLKRLLALGDYGAVAAGLAIDAPTGSDVTGQFTTTSFTMHNQAVHLAPYIGFLRAADDRLFCQGFLQLDVPMNGNQVDYTDTVFPPGTFGTFTEQTLLYADISAGYWLCRNPYANVITGLASILEFHYTTTLSDADVVAGSVATLPQTYQFGNLLGHVDVTNVTVGLHSEWFGNTTLRVAGVFPLHNNIERPFDAEVVVSLNLYH